ncbi:hypothetical protein OPIT5_04105 [Opitutaceae bacterium TAV5]|nr:hypothetical protein OPIT5_04105 [Opitutaceae bacterium TAV5]
MGHLLAEYFCPNDGGKRTLLYDEILTTNFFGLERKKQLFRAIVKIDYPSYWEENKETLVAFDDVQRFRNKLAHSRVDVSEEALARPLEQGVGFTDWKNSEPVTEAQFQDMIAKVNMIISCILEIKRLLPFKERKLVTHGLASTPTDG